jgi:hypothetical protein
VSVSPESDNLLWSEQPIKVKSRSSNGDSFFFIT